MSWFEGSPMGIAPKPRYGVVSAVLDEKRILVVGGRNLSADFFSDCWLLTYETITWNQVESSGPLPPVVFSSGDVVGSRIYMFGGKMKDGCFGEILSASIDCLLSTNVKKSIQWELIESKGPKPTPRYGHTCNSVDGKRLIFYGGAQGSNFYSDIYYFFPETNTWKKPNCSGIGPEGRCYHTSTLIGRNLYIFGGMGKSKILADVYVFNVDTDNWTKVMLPGTPQARFGHTATAIGNSIIMYGGRAMPSEPSDGEGGGGDLIDSFASGVPVLDTENRGWVSNNLENKVTDEDVAHQSAVGISSKVVFLFGLKLVIKKSGRKLNPQLEITNKHRILYHLESISLQFHHDGSQTKGERGVENKRIGKRKSQHFLNRLEKRKSGGHQGAIIARDSSPSITRRKDAAAQKKPKKEKSAGSIGLPYNIVHRAHVDVDFNWTGGKAGEMFTMQEKLGKGAYATVYKGIHKESGFILAIKEIEDIDDDEDLKKEIDILKACRHPNIVCYYGTCDTQKSLWILMDYCGMGSVRDMIESRQKVLQDAEIRYILKQSLKGLSYLHVKGIIHRDIKAANILMNKEGDIKLADFGVSEQLCGAVHADDIAGSPHWMAPEVVLEKDYDARCDIWSMGVTAIEMAEGLPPKAHMNPVLAMKSVPKDPPPKLKEEEKHVPEFPAFLLKCLVKEPTDRPSSIDMLMDPFINDAGTHEVLRSTVTEMLKIRKAKQQEKERQQIEKEKQEKEKKEKEKEREKEKEKDKGRQRSGASVLPPPLSSRSGGIGILDYIQGPNPPATPEQNFGTFVQNDEPNLGTFIATDEGNFGTFVSKDEDTSSAPDSSAFGTFVAKDDEPSSNFGTFVVSDSPGSSGSSEENFGTFIARSEESVSQNLGTFVTKGEEDSSPNLGTFVTKSNDPPPFGTFVSKSDVSASAPNLSALSKGGGGGNEFDSPQFGTFVTKGPPPSPKVPFFSGGAPSPSPRTPRTPKDFPPPPRSYSSPRVEEGKLSDSGGDFSDGSENLGTFIIFSEDPASFATLQKTPKTNRRAPLPPPLLPDLPPPPPTPTPPAAPPLPLPRNIVPEVLPENADGFDLSDAFNLIRQLRAEIELLRQTSRTSQQW